MKTPKLAKDIMATKLVTLPPHMDVFEAISLLLKHEISGAPVVDDDGNYLGVISERCCINVLVEAAYEGLPTTEVLAYMDTSERTITEETDLFTIAQLFQDSQVRRLPVLRGEKLVGQISRRDVLRAAHELHAIAPDHETALLYLSSLMDRGEAPIA